MSQSNKSSINSAGDVFALGIPSVELDGLSLVARKHAIECVSKIFSGSYRFWGFDGFVILPDGTIQPSINDIMDCSYEQ
ncbi:hypothetical protein L4C36_09800, partial [Photobacterium japonica]|uniref:hypothetical protein n=1 Tax=Photobacterium japonica TaxID=2910235 RepID=UPI003D12D1FC